MIVCAYLLGMMTHVLKAQQKNTMANRKHVVEHTKPVQRIPINVNTQSVGHYEQVGLLYDGHTTLPLMGRRTYNRSTRWNYYTLTNDNIAIRIPLSNKGRDCLDRNGCDELYDDDAVIIPEYNNSKFVVKLYDNSPRYIPF